MNKRIVREQIEDITSELDSTLDSVIEHLQAMKEEYKDKYFNLFIEKEIPWDSNYQNDTVYFYLCGGRKETDSEYNKRIKIQSNLKQNKVDRKRKLYEELKKEFGE